MASGPKSSGFDRVARIYRWGEYISFGPFLALTRRAHVQALKHAKHAVIFGDGDGRFTHLALRTHAHLRVTAIDSSTAMLNLLRRRCHTFSDRLITIQADATDPALDLTLYDAAVAHFFLDCLSSHDVDDVVSRANGVRLWIISDFDEPPGALQLPAKLLVRSLYLAFHFLTGLEARSLPRWRTSAASQAFQIAARKKYLGGILFSEVWTR